MGGFNESFQRELGKPAIQITCAAATVLLSVGATFLAHVEPSSAAVTACLAAASLLAFCISLWFGRLSVRREKAAELKRRADIAKQTEVDKPPADTMSEDTLKVLRFFFYHEYDLSLEDIKLGFKLDANAAQVHLDDLEKRKFIRPTTISGIGADTECFKLTPAGRAHAMKNMFS